VIVVCNSGAVTANFLKEKLARNFRIRIIDTVSYFRLPGALEQKKPDLIISTIPLEATNIATVQISPVLGDEDLVSVKQALEQIGKTLNKRKTVPGDGTAAPSDLPLAELFIEPHIDMCCFAPDWREAITSAGRLLIDTGCISYDYVLEMIRTVEDHGSYIVFIPGVALAHGRPPSTCQKPCASLVRLRPPVPFGHPKNDPVSYVLAVQTPNTDEHFNTLFRVMNMMCDERFRERLDQAGDNSQASLIICEYETLLYGGQQGVDT